MGGTPLLLVLFYRLHLVIFVSLNQQMLLR